MKEIVKKAKIIRKLKGNYHALSASSAKAKLLLDPFYVFLWGEGELVFFKRFFRDCKLTRCGSVKSAPRSPTSRGPSSEGVGSRRRGRLRTARLGTSHARAKSRTEAEGRRYG